MCKQYLDFVTNELAGEKVVVAKHQYKVCVFYSPSLKIRDIEKANSIQSDPKNVNREFGQKNNNFLTIPLRYPSQ